MAIAQNALTTGEEDNGAGVGTTSTTGSFSPADDALVLMVVVNWRDDSTNTAAVTATGGGMTTWDQIDTDGFHGHDTSGSFRGGITILRSQEASPGTGTVTITGNTNDVYRAWSVMEFTGTRIGDNGQDAIVQTATGATTGNSATATLSAFGDAANALYVGGSAQAQASFGDTVGTFDFATGITVEHEQISASGLANLGYMGSGYDLTSPDTTPSITEDVGTIDLGLTALEIQEPAPVVAHNKIMGLIGSGV